MNLSREKVKEIIRLADDWEEQYRRVHSRGPGAVSAGDISFESLEAYRDDPVRLKLQAAMEELPREEQAELSALYRLGEFAGDDSMSPAESWQLHVDNAQRENPDRLVPDLMAKQAGLISEFLAAGLKQLDLI